MAALALLFAVAASVGGASPSSPIWPVPQEGRYSEERLLLRDAVVVVPEGDRRAQLPGRLLAEQIADELGVAIPVVSGATAPKDRVAIVVGEAGHPLVAAAVAKSGVSVPPRDEGYVVSVGDAGAVLAGRDYR